MLILYTPQESLDQHAGKNVHSDYKIGKHII